MATDPRLFSERFPLSTKYHPDWILHHASSGSHSLWLAEWLAEAMGLRPGMRVLDLGCGKALTSIFLRREFGVEVWATDLWFGATDNARRIAEAGVADRVFPIHADARSLPFAADFFDAITCVDSYYYFGTDALYLNYLAQFLRPGGRLGVAGAGLVREIDSVPEHLRSWWTQDLHALHSADWLARLWGRTGIVDVENADTLADGWRLWLQWHRTGFPDNLDEIRAVEADAGRTLGYARVVGRRREGVKLQEYCWPDTLRSMPATPFETKPLLRGGA